jgi:hypothetical protein
MLNRRRMSALAALAVGGVVNIYCAVRRIDPPHFIDQTFIAALGVFFAPSSKKKADDDEA